MTNTEIETMCADILDGRPEYGAAVVLLIGPEGCKSLLLARSGVDRTLIPPAVIKLANQMAENKPNKLAMAFPSKAPCS